MNGESTLAAWLERLERMHPISIDLGLARVGQVRDRLALGALGVVFTVGGTNGKGSTCAMLEAMLRAAGYRVGLYTSPHLLRYNERVRLAGRAATDAELVAAFAAVERVRGEVSLTYFEMGTLAAAWLFAAAQLDAVILEVGLGGRLDAVNLFDADCSIVTSVDLDHMNFLGDTREQIGSEKAHIYRGGRPAICADDDPPQTLLQHAAAIGAGLLRIGRDFGFEAQPAQWTYWGRDRRKLALGYPALRGAMQLRNASAAIAALDSVRERLPVDAGAIRNGLATVEIAGRFQVLPGRPTIVLDVGHNPQAARVLADNLDHLAATGDDGAGRGRARTLAVCAMLRDKDIAGVCRALRSHIDAWFVAGLPGQRGTSAAEMAQAVAAASPWAPVSGFDDVVGAFGAAREAAGQGDRIVVFGSFLTVAAVLADLQSHRGGAPAR